MDVVIFGHRGSKPYGLECVTATVTTRPTALAVCIIVAWIAKRPVLLLKRHDNATARTEINLRELQLLHP